MSTRVTGPRFPRTDRAAPQTNPLPTGIGTDAPGLDYAQVLLVLNATNKFMRAVSKYGYEDAYFIGRSEVFHFHDQLEVDMRIGRAGISFFREHSPVVVLKCKLRRDWIAVPLSAIDMGELRILLRLTIEEN